MSTRSTDSAADYHEWMLIGAQPSATDAETAKKLIADGDYHAIDTSSTAFRVLMAIVMNNGHKVHIVMNLIEKFDLSPERAILLCIAKKRYGLARYVACSTNVHHYTLLAACLELRDIDAIKSYGRAFQLTADDLAIIETEMIRPYAVACFSDTEKAAVDDALSHFRWLIDETTWGTVARTLRLTDGRSLKTAPLLIEEQKKVQPSLLLLYEARMLRTMRTVTHYYLQPTTKDELAACNMIISAAKRSAVGNGAMTDMVTLRRLADASLSPKFLLWHAIDNWYVPLMMDFLVGKRRGENHSAMLAVYLSLRSGRLRRFLALQGVSHVDWKLDENWLREARKVLPDMSLFDVYESSSSMSTAFTPTTATVGTPTAASS